MENTGILKEWFDRVDSEKSGSIIAPQLQVDLLLFLIQRFYPLRLKVPIVDKISGFFHDQNALAVGNLNFPVSIVQQMIRFPKSLILMISVKNFLLIVIIIFWLGCMILIEMEL